jgi:lipid-binding SYLF domain-containing protein
MLLILQPILQSVKERIKNDGTVMTEILNVPDNVPPQLLEKAACVIVHPSVLKIAVGMGGSYGRGVMTCRGGNDFDEATIQLQACKGLMPPAPGKVNSGRSLQILPFSSGL